MTSTRVRSRVGRLRHVFVLVCADGHRGFSQSVHSSCTKRIPVNMYTTLTGENAAIPEVLVLAERGPSSSLSSCSNCDPRAQSSFNMASSSPSCESTSRKKRKNGNQLPLIRHHKDGQQSGRRLLMLYAHTHTLAGRSDKWESSKRNRIDSVAIIVSGSSCSKLPS